jgi:hypothetical protein
MLTSAGYLRSRRTLRLSPIIRSAEWLAPVATGAAIRTHAAIERIIFANFELVIQRFCTFVIAVQVNETWK